MTISSHVQELRKKHRHLSEMVEMEQRSPAADDLQIREMKKQKLYLKQQIARLEH